MVTAPNTSESKEPKDEVKVIKSEGASQPERQEERNETAELIAKDRLAIESVDAAQVEIEHKGPNIKDKIEQDLEGIAEIADHKIPGLEHMDVFEIRVTDKDRWGSKETAEKMIVPFGEVIFESVKSRKDPRVFTMGNTKLVESLTNNVLMEGGDIASSDKVYVVANKEKIIGFYTLGYTSLKDGSMLAIEQLVGFMPDFRNKNIASSLFELIYKNEDVGAFASITHTPGAVKSLLKTGKQFGYTGFYCGQKNGEFGQKGTEEENVRLHEISEILRNEYKETSVQGEIQEGYVVINRAINPIPPLAEDELRFSDGDPLGETFRKGLLQVQKKYNPHSVFGMLINLKNPME
jgi:hypothetical protein